MWVRRRPGRRRTANGLPRHRLVDHLAAGLHLAVEPLCERARLLLVGAARDHEAPAPDDAVALGLEPVGQLDGRLVVARRDPDLPGREALGDQLVVVVVRRLGAVPALLVGEPVLGRRSTRPRRRARRAPARSACALARGRATSRRRRAAVPFSSVTASFRSRSSAASSSASDSRSAEPAEQAALLLVPELDAEPPVVACHRRNARDRLPSRASDQAAAATSDSRRVRSHGSSLRSASSTVPSNWISTPPSGARWSPAPAIRRR